MSVTKNGPCAKTAEDVLLCCFSLVIGCARAPIFMQRAQHPKYGHRFMSRSFEVLQTFFKMLYCRAF